MNASKPTSRFLIAATAIYAPVWLALWLAWLSIRTLPAWLAAVGFTLSLAVAAPWLLAAWRARRTRPRFGLAIASVAYVFVWHWFVFMADVLDLPHLSRSSAQFGLAALFFIGLAWVIWGLERASDRYQRQRRATADERSVIARPTTEAESLPATGRVWNPLDSFAWYYGRSSLL
jgi:hypothetical protein